MTDKEKIIINGIDVSKCKYLRGDYCDLHMENEFLCHCEDYPDCDYKQLVRKTQECEQLKEDYAELEQECEELKSESFTREELISIQEKDIASYREALDEIEEYIYTDCEYNDGCDRNICIRCDYSNVHDKRILDIISKAKGCI